MVLRLVRALARVGVPAVPGTTHGRAKQFALLLANRNHRVCGGVRSRPKQNLPVKAQKHSSVGDLEG